MPNNATQLYRKNPNLQIVLDFLGRCAPEGQHMTAHYRDAQEVDAVRVACTALGLHPENKFPLHAHNGAGKAESRKRHGITFDREDWLALAENAMPSLTRTLCMRLPAINAALNLFPVPWASLADGVLAAWGVSAGMVALPVRTVFDYFGTRYPSSARQRGRYAMVRDVGSAATVKENRANGFIFEVDNTSHFICTADRWQDEVTSARVLLDDHLSLMLKVGLQMLEAGASGHLNQLRQVLSLAGEASSLVRLQTLLETYEDHIESYGPGQNPFRSKLLNNCLGAFDRWRARCGLDIRQATRLAYSANPSADSRNWKWTDEGAAVTVTPTATIATTTIATTTTPTATTATSTTATATSTTATSTTATSTTATSTIAATTPTADPVVADGVVIPEGVTVASGACVRICAITPETRLKPGTVLHGDVSIASHTRFDGPLTIMHDVRIGRGLVFSPGLVLAEGATILSFIVKCLLPGGTRIGGNLRIGEKTTVGNNVTFGAENWIGNGVHVGENVRFGPFVKVDDGISIGDNARIEGHVQISGDIPAHAEVAANAAARQAMEGRQHGPACVVGISRFTITKHETILDRSPTKRQPLALELPLAQPCVNNGQDRAMEEVGAMDPPSCTALPGEQRKRIGGVMEGRSAKRHCPNLKTTCEEAQPEPTAPDGMPRTSDGAAEKPGALSRLLNQSVSPPILATEHRTWTSMPSWQDLQAPEQDALRAPPVPISAVGLSGRHGSDIRQAARREPVAGPPSPGASADRSPTHKAWETSVAGDGSRHAVDLDMRQLVRVPTASPGTGQDAPAPLPTARPLSPMHGSKGPNL